MLSFNHKHHFKLLSLQPTQALTFSPVPSEDDELIEAIEASDDDGKITLDPVPDVQQLDSFWSSVEDDLQHDPNWFDFTNDE